MVLQEIFKQDMDLLQVMIAQCIPRMFLELQDIEERFIQVH